MKQNGVRLVQRKFAQGVPIPASISGAAPPPPEKKPDLPYPPKNVYHNNMSARSLLDIVSMQNIHEHKPQPLVVLERLRDDEIPTPPVAKMRVRLRKRRGIKVNKNNMCLRSGKRKSTDAIKGSARKRKKLYSTDTDDLPLIYHKPKDIDKNDILEREKRTLAQKRRERNTRLSVNKPAPPTETKKSDDRFTFKEPTSPARISYRLVKKKAVTNTGRVLKKAGLAKPGARWASLRSARAASETRAPRPLRNTVLLAKKPPKPAVRKGLRTAIKDERSSEAPSQPGPSGAKAPKPPPEIKESTSPVPGPSSCKATKPPPVVTRPTPAPSPAPSSIDVLNIGVGPPPSPTLSMDFALELPLFETAGGAASGTTDWCVKRSPSVKSKMSEASDLTDVIAPRPPEKVPASNTPTPPVCKQNVIEDNIDRPNLFPQPIKLEELSLNIEQTDLCSEDTVKVLNEKIQKEIEPESNIETNEPVISEQEVTNLNQEKDNTPLEEIVVPQATRELDRTRAVRQRRDEACKDKGVNKTIAKKAGKMPREKKDSGKKPAPKPAIKEAKKPKPKRGAKPPGEAAPTPRLLRNAPPNPDVYEFDAELEAARPPSGLRRRGLPTPEAPTSPPDTVEYVDILPTSSHCIEMTPKKGQQNGGEYPSISLVPKEEISVKKKKNLIENLSNSPALLNRFFNCLTAEMQNELDNLITAEGLNEASTSNEASTYLDQKAGSVLDAPTFHPTAEEFQDPIKYYHKIAPKASRFGLCKIVPPEGFKPPCNMNDSIRFAVIYQYISKMYSRWGPVSRELAAIKAHLWSQSVVFTRPPLLDGSEVNLPKLYHAVERNGGLSAVIKRNRWGRVAEEMKLGKLQNPEKKLDPIYMRYLLPYATLSDQERQNIMAKVEKCWTTKYQKMLERARNPFQRQNRMLGTESESDDDGDDGNTAALLEAEDCIVQGRIMNLVTFKKRQNRMLGTESESDDDGDDGNTAALLEAEDCIVQGRIMNLVTFKKIATSLMDAHFEPNKQPPNAAEVEKAYWRAVLLGTEHIVANTASIDTGEEGYGFPKDPEAEYGTHPWNLKVLARNPNNVLRYLGPVLGVTVPTLHLSMLFSTSCWHRDPHGLPWTEYMHSGAEKIWYGIPKDESANFRRAVETLCPAYCQNKAIWLASEITMVPPNILSEHGVKLSKLSQRPGEYVLVFPEAHSCSITTGFGISESVYFASNAWLKNVYKLFQELRNSCEPTMFSLEQLLLNGSADEAAPPQVCAVLCTLLSAELEHRRALDDKGLKVQERPPPAAPLNTSYFRAWNARDQDECEYCRCTLFLSKVTGLTGRKSAFCPEHALRLLETKKYKNVNLADLEFLSSYTTSALEEMLERLEPRTEESDKASGTDSPVSVIDLTEDTIKTQGPNPDQGQV